MFEKPQKWARARMAPETWERLRQSTAGLSGSLNRGASASRRWVTIGSEHVTSMRSARFEPWRIILAALAVFIVALIFSPLEGQGLDTVPALLLLVCVGLSTYMADWVGGVTASVVSLICLDVFFIGDTPALDSLPMAQSFVIMAVFALASAAAVATIEHLKYDRANARLEAASLRAANTALSAVEIAAAQRPPGDQPAYVNVLATILTAMVRVNRASTGALYLLDAPSSTLIRAAAYGEVREAELDGESSRFDVAVGSGLAGRVALERRPIAVFDTLAEEDIEDILETNPHARSVVGVPLIDPSDKLVGVAWVGLYVPYRFGLTAIARLTALANRTIAFMEAARLADDQGELLDRVQDHYRRLQAVIQTIPEAVMVARPPHGAIVASNAAAQRMFGVDLDGPSETRRADRLRLSGTPDSEFENPILQSLRQGVVVTGVELTVRQTDGTTIPVVASAAPLRDDDGTIDAVVGIFQDVAPLKEAERLRDEFVSVVSHELRSPLTPIRGFAQVVARDLQREGNHEQHVAWLLTLQQHVDRMTRLVDDLLDVSRLRAGRLKIVRAPTDVVGICRSVVDSWNATSTRHEVKLVTDRETEEIQIDGDRIYQVLDNLVGNAVKYANDGPIVVAVGDASLAGTPRAIGIDIIDEGPGIHANDRDAVFTPFFRARNASQSAVPGLGLGLYISNELIREHGGAITVSETATGGSCFAVTLPLPDRPRRSPLGFEEPVRLSFVVD
ncbi:MAG: GAF domain-containing protein [Chloroflexia bacterium]|nr:GAF domain-containing protein [Chloroflexia bacterium]